MSSTICAIACLWAICRLPLKRQSHRDNACTNHPANTTRRVGLVRLWLPSFEGSANHSRPCQIGSGRQVSRVCSRQRVLKGACMQQFRGYFSDFPLAQRACVPKMPAHQATCIRAAGGSHSASQRSQARQGLPSSSHLGVYACAGWNPSQRRLLPGRLRLLPSGLFFGGGGGPVGTGREHVDRTARV